MILTAYIDESGTHAGSKSVSVAGYLSTPARWVSYDKEWREALADFGIEFFHMSAFAVGAPPYNAWEEPERRRRIARLIGIINRHVEFSVGNVIPVQLFDEVFPPEAKKYCGGPYGLAAIATFMAVGKMIREHYPDQWVGYVFETGAEGKGQILRTFASNERRLKEKHHLRLWSLKFENKRHNTPLQAADILAYELYQQLPRQLGYNARPARRFHLEPLAKVPHDWGHSDRDQLTMFAQIISVRVALDAAERS